MDKTSRHSSAVARRLEQVAQRFPRREVELFSLPGFLEEDICDDLCVLIDVDRRPSTIADDCGVANYRTSETCELPGDHPLIASVNARLEALLGVETDLGEPLQGQRYDVGQEFREHTDTFNPGGWDYLQHCDRQGQRTWTAMVYLNTPAQGGATRFKRLNKTFQPAVGTLLAWNNILPDGSPNEWTLHQGMKVRAGCKYIITKWYRERAAST